MFQTLFEFEDVTLGSGKLGILIDTHTHLASTNAVTLFHPANIASLMLLYPRAQTDIFKCFTLSEQQFKTNQNFNLFFF